MLQFESSIIDVSHLMQKMARNLQAAIREIVLVERKEHSSVKATPRSVRELEE